MRFPGVLIVVFFFLRSTFSISSAESEIFQVTDTIAMAEWTKARHEAAFTAFIKKYGKEYSSGEEYTYRLAVFAKNTMRAAENQILDPTAVHGTTPFSDLTAQEFERSFTGVLMGKSVMNSAKSAMAMTDTRGLPENFDWREMGAVTGVKTQGVCGSCWAFSTAGALEGANFIASGKLVDLSEQQLVDCDHTCDAVKKSACDNGCSGGLMTNAYEYLIETGGLEDEESYPYTGSIGQCKFNKENVAVKVKNFTTIPPDEDQIAAHLINHGPLAVGLNAAFMQTYIGGVSCPLICPRKMVNHGVLLVGYGGKGFSILRFGNRPYWIIKNSWGANWGEDGYYRLCRGHNTCGISSLVSAVTASA